jgi:hypothetical protein
MRFNPLYPQWYVETLGMSLMVARCYEDAVKVLSGLRDPAYYVHAYLAGCLVKIGRDDEARLHRERVLTLKLDWTPEHFRADPYQHAEDIEHIGELMRMVARAG